MKLDLHSDISIRRMSIGAERAPLLVIDNCVVNPDELVAHASSQVFAERSRY